VPRLVERYFTERIPPTEKKTRPTKRCVMCYKNNTRKETVFWCPECEADLRVEESFKAFHSKLTFLGTVLMNKKSVVFPKYYVSGFIEIQPLLIKLH
jgi:hypothetical protein